MNKYTNPLSSNSRKYKYTSTAQDSGKEGTVKTLTDVVVLLEGGDAVLVLVLVKVRLHVGDLDAGLVRAQFGVVYCVAVLYHQHILGAKTIRVEALEGKLALVFVFG